MTTQTHKTKEIRSHLPAFSLVEILVVIAVISLLLAATVPIFSNSSSNARQSSREIVKAHIRQARSHAISTGVHTAITIPSLQSGKDLGLRSLSLFEVVNENGKFIPRKDAQNNEIQLQSTAILPGNYHFVTQALIGSANATVVDAQDTMVTNYRNQQHICHIIVFAPDGRIVTPQAGTNLQIALAKATHDGNNLKITEKSEGQAVFDLFQISRLTGKIRFVEP